MDSFQEHGNLSWVYLNNGFLKDIMNTKIFARNQIVKYHLYIDEIIFDKTETQKLTLLYFGVLIPIETLNDIETEIKNALLLLDKKKFHSKTTYKREENLIVSDKINEIIIKNKLRIFCFPFVKDWLKSPRLEILKKFELPEVEKFKFDNYLSQAWLLFIHTFNSYITTIFEDNCRIRLFFDKDWIKANRMVVHEGIKLNRIAEIISTKQNDTPLLALADHVGYYFRKFKRQSRLNSNSFFLNNFYDTDYNNENCIKLFKSLVANKLFKTIDLWEWIEYENNFK